MSDPQKRRGLTQEDLEALREKDRQLKRSQEAQLRQMKEFDRVTGRDGSDTIIVTETITWP